MNELKPWVSALCISAFQISNIHAEVAVIDSFMEAGFELDGSPEGITSTYSSIESTVVGGGFKFQVEPGLRESVSKERRG